MSDDDEPPTFDLTISDVDVRGMAALLGGIGLHAHQGAIHDVPEVVEDAGKMTQKILTENPEAARYVLLDSTVAEFAEIVSADDTILDDLDLELVDGEVMDARTRTDIEVE